MGNRQKVLILDFGGQYNQLIARRVRDLGVYSELKNSDMSVEEIKEYAPIGIIFTGGPNSVYEETAPRIDKGIFSLGIPVLGICYGCQLIAYELGGIVRHAETSEYGKRDIRVLKESLLFKGVPEISVSWMSHTDHVVDCRAGLIVWLKRRKRRVPLRRSGATIKKFMAYNSTPKWRIQNTETNF